MEPKTDAALTRAILADDLRLRLRRARHTPGVRCAQLLALTETATAYAEGRTLAEALEVLVENLDLGANHLSCRGTVVGSDPPTDLLDAAVYGGCEVEARRALHPTAVVALLDEMVVYKTPIEIIDRVRATGVAESHKERGLTYETKRERMGVVITRVVDEKWAVYPWSWTMRRVGEGDTLAEALERALAAEPFEAKG